MQILIIGNSAAGIGASEAIRQHDKECAITMMSEETGPIYSRCLLSYYLSGHIDQTRLAFRPDSFYQENNVRLIAGKRAAAVDVSRQCVICDDDSKINYDKLLIATGASAKIPEFIQVPVQGIHVLRTLADAVAIQQRINSVRHVVVLGGGLVGMKAAFALQKRGLDVTVVVRSKHALSQMIDYQGAQMVMSRLHENNIKIFIEADITDIKVRDKNIESVMMKDFSIDSNQEIPCELLIAAKGVHANMELLKETNVELKEGIVADSHMQTSVENIYAAGDVAETVDLATGQRQVNALWTCAVQQGKIAGLNMIGIEKKYDGSLAMNSINFPGLELISFGIVRPLQDSEYEILTNQDNERQIYQKIVLKDNRIKGLVLINRIDSAGILLSLLRRTIDVGPFKTELIGSRFKFSRLVAHLGKDELKRYWNAPRIIRSR